MSYMEIPNLYKAREILLFKECYALEKIHGTSAHIGWNHGELKYSSGGANFNNFFALFDHKQLEEIFNSMQQEKITVYGEAYGGKTQGMSNTYGKALKFVCFEVLINDLWLAVPQAEEIIHSLGLEFVHYEIIPATPKDIDAHILLDSVQAVRNGMGPGHKREGDVLRPLIEVRKNNGERIIAKHKREDFKETKERRSLDEEKLKVLEEAAAIAEEWVTDMRLIHVLDLIPQPWDIRQTEDVVRAMIADVLKESKGEIVDSKDARKAIGRKAAQLFKARFKL
jgi:hypothetical protein